MCLGNTNYYLPAIFSCHWYAGSSLSTNDQPMLVSSHASELCGVFSLSRYMKDIPRTQRQSGYKSLGSHLELCLSPPGSCFLSCEWTQPLWSQMAQCTEKVMEHVHFNKHMMRMRWDIMCHPRANDQCSKKLSWPFQKWFVHPYLFIQLLMYWFTL